ncbi:hypothetical protein ACFE04_012085 [Oxalis oulophora]
MSSSSSSSSDIDIDIDTSNRCCYIVKIPSALLGSIMMNMDITSIVSLASTCKSLHASALHILSFIPSFILQLIRPLFPPNPYLHTIKLNCNLLNDSSTHLLLRPSLHHLYLHSCSHFTGKLLYQIGNTCPHLRSLYLGSLAHNRGSSIHIIHLQELLKGCPHLQGLFLMFDVSLFLPHNFTPLWALASHKLTSLQIGYISSLTVTQFLSPNLIPHQPSILPNILKLCLSVDYISDTMVTTISQALPSLNHLDLRDAPLIEPRITFDLTNSGLQQINQHGNLKHLSLIRSQEFILTFFRRVNDIGVLFMADKCAHMESICLGGFSRVTDTGFKTILHSCRNLYKLKVYQGAQLTNLVFHDISATSLSLTHVALKSCKLLTNHAITSLVCNVHLKVLELRDCKSLGDDALGAIASLPKLKKLLLDGSDITDVGLSYLKRGVICSLVTLSVRGCKKLTDKFISTLFNGSSKFELQELDVSNLPNLSDNGILSLAKSRIPISELRIRQCPLIGDTSVMALASMQVDDGRWHGSQLRLLDLYNCGGITQLAYKWLKKPYFPRLRRLGVTGSINRDIVDALARNRPFLQVLCRGEELGANPLVSFLVKSYLCGFAEKL